MSKARETSASYPIRAVQVDRHWYRCAARVGAPPWRRHAHPRRPGPDVTDADIARLRLLRAAVEHGHAIGRLAGLTDAALRRLAATASASAVSGAAPTRRTPIDTAALTAALHKYDAVAIDQQISRLASVLPPLELLRDVLMPVLAQVGNDWHRGPARIAHEHLMSSTIRNILGSFLRLTRAPRRRPGCSLRPWSASATRLARWVPPCSPPTAAWVSCISVPICRRAKLSKA